MEDLITSRVYLRIRRIIIQMIVRKTSLCMGKKNNFHLIVAS